jgi:hypothetical protein
MSNSSDQVTEAINMGNEKVRNDHVEEAPTSPPIDASSDYSDVAPTVDGQSSSQKRRR